MWDETVREALNGSFDAVVAVDVVARILDHNDAATEMFRGLADELIGEDFAWLVVADEDRNRFQSELGEVATDLSDAGGNSSKRLQLRIRSGDQETTLADVSLSRTTINKSAAVNIFIRDASERVQAETDLALHDTQARLFQRATAFTLESDSYEDALQHSLGILSEITGWPAGHVYVPDADGNSLVSADVWHFEEGTGPEQLRPRLSNIAFAKGQGLPGRIWETIEPCWIEDATGDESLIRARVFEEAGVRGVFGFPITTGDDVIAVMEFYSPQPMAPDAQLLEMVASIGSQLGRLMERSRAQEAQARQAAIVATSSDAIIGKSLDGTITTWNEGAEQVYGYAAAEVIGRPITLLAPDASREEEVILDVAKHGRRLDNFETTRRRSDGSIIPVSISASPIFDSDGTIVGTASIERDITQRKQREQELEQAKDRAEDAARTKSQFLANVSHELRTPMNAIIGMIDLSFQEQLSPRLRDYMETVRDASRTLLDLINDVLDFSRMEVGTFQLVEEPFDLRDVLDRSIRTLAIRADEKGLELACRIHPDVPECLQGDGRRLRQIVMNLVGNAIKFTDEGEVVVDVGIGADYGEALLLDDSPSRSGSQTDDSESRPTVASQTLTFSVRDTGAGIAPEFHKSIFEPFTQVDASSTRAHSGSGLGLAICRELAHKMDGDISVESEPGSGSCFRFTAAFKAATGDQIERLERFEPTGDLIGMRVLVVDDNATNRTILDDLLTRWKMHPTLAESGEAALEQLRMAVSRDERFPLILLDALMPHMDGFMLLQSAAEEGLIEGATILMLSSAERVTFERQCEEAPVAAFLEKPVSQSDLFDSIITALHGSGMKVEPSGGLQPSEKPLRLLVAEDTPANQKVVRLMLEQRGHEVTFVENGRLAVDAVERDAFDAVLMDVQMPELDGLAATGEIRGLSDATRAATPIVALTAHAVAGDQERCLAAGMDAYVAKPIELFELIRTVEEAAGLDVGRLTVTRTLQTGSEPTESDADVFNYEVALSRLNGNVDLFRDMVAFFGEDAPRLLDEVASSIESGTATQVRRAAHSLKGLCANFEAEQARDVALRMEEAGRDEDLTTASELFPRLSAEVSRLTAALQGHLA